jgi:hypothetical protein
LGFSAREEYFMRKVWSTKHYLAVAIFGAIVGNHAASASECRVISAMRVETAQDIERLQDVCEVTDSLAIFADGVEKIVLPNLKRAGLINVESMGLKALAMPSLTSVRDLYISGADLEAAEFPALQEVSAHLVIRERNVKFLNLPELRKVNRLVLQSCLNLQFVFADKLYDVGSSSLDGNPSLNPGSASVITSVTRKLSPEEAQYVKDAQDQIRAFKLRLIENAAQPPIRPTGHPTKFDSFGLIKSYYDWYPYQYNDYWYSIGPWGFTAYYRF